jgi:hypothetical protein
MGNIDYVTCSLVATVTDGRHTKKAPSVGRETTGTGEMFVADSLDDSIDGAKYKQISLLTQQNSEPFGFQLLVAGFWFSYM